jgi:hypothetical protein
VAMKIDDFKPPLNISFACPEACKKETTWPRVYPRATVTSPEGLAGDLHLKALSYSCMRCSKARLTIFYREVEVAHDERRTSNPFSPSTITVDIVRVVM